MQEPLQLGLQDHMHVWNSMLVTSFLYRDILFVFEVNNKSQQNKHIVWNTKTQMKKKGLVYNK